MLILIPVDGSEHAQGAVHHALRLRQGGLRADFLLANVQEPTHLYEVVLAPNAELLQAASDAAGAHALAAAEALLSAAGASYQSEVAHGEPAPTLLEIAERRGVDAIILGTRGAGSLRDALLGSVSQTVLRDATVPVTVVRHAQPLPVAEPDEGPDELPEPTEPLR